MTNFLDEGMITWLNDFLPKSGVTNLISPATVVLIKANPDYKNKSSYLGHTLVYTSVGPAEVFSKLQL